MINAFEAAELSEKHELIMEWKRKIEQAIMEHIESERTTRSVCLCCNTEDNGVIDAYIIPWLSNLRYKVWRDSGDAGHDGPYNNLIIQW